MVIFDCNGVLVDSETIVASVAEEEFARVGLEMPAELIERFFTGRRVGDMISVVEAATRRKLPIGFDTVLTTATLRRFRAELRATPHAACALSWLRGPKCVASSATLERVRTSLEIADLLPYFGTRLFSGNDVRNDKPAPDLFLYVAARMRVEPADCVVVEDSTDGIQAAVAAGMKAIGFAGGSHATPQLRDDLMRAGAHVTITDLRTLKRVIGTVRGW